MQNYEIVYAAICRLGGARLDRITKESGLSRSTVSRAIRELETDYMIHLKNKVWYSTSAGQKTLGQLANSSELGQDRSLRCRQTEKPRGSGQACLYPDSLPAGFFGEEGAAGMAPPNAGPTGLRLVVAQDADLPMAMKWILEEIADYRSQFNTREGIRKERARISKKKRGMDLYDSEVTRELRVLARFLWVARTDNTWESDQAFQAWLLADMDRLVSGWREQVNQVVVEMGVAA